MEELILNSGQLIVKLEWCHTLREYYYIDYTKFNYLLENRKPRIWRQNKSRKTTTYGK